MNIEEILFRSTDLYDFLLRPVSRRWTVPLVVTEGRSFTKYLKLPLSVLGVFRLSNINEVNVYPLPLCLSNSRNGVRGATTKTSRCRLPGRRGRASVGSGPTGRRGRVPEMVTGRLLSRHGLSGPGPEVILSFHLLIPVSPPLSLR